MELARVKAREWETWVQAVEGFFCLRLQLRQKSEDQLSDLIKCVVSNLYPK